VDSTHAREVLLNAVWEEAGTYILLRLGEDPGGARIVELRQALRALALHWRSQASIPFDIAHAAATIMHFENECRSNMQSLQPERAAALASECQNLAQDAFNLLCGPDAHMSMDG
jgi:hypothetical protein